MVKIRNPSEANGIFFTMNGLQYHTNQHCYFDRFFQKIYVMKELFSPPLIFIMLPHQCFPWVYKPFEHVWSKPILSLLRQMTSLFTFGATFYPLTCDSFFTSKFAILRWTIPYPKAGFITVIFFNNIKEVIWNVRTYRVSHRKSVSHMNK